jgi:hypothetical protein
MPNTISDTADAGSQTGLGLRVAAVVAVGRTSVGGVYTFFLRT